MLGVLENFRCWFAFRMAQDSIDMIEVTAQFHVSNCDDSIEPRVSQRLHCLLETVLIDPLFELLPFRCDGTGMFSTGDHGHVATFHNRLGPVGRQPVVGSAIRHRLDEILASLRCVVFQFGAVHGCLIESGCVRCWRWPSQAPAAECRGSRSRRLTFPGTSPS